MKEGLRFDWYNIINLPSLSPLEDELVEVCLSNYTNKGKKREEDYKRLCRSVLSSLYQAYYSIPFGDSLISIPKKTEVYSLKGGGKIKFNSRYVFTLVHVLKQKKWIKVYPGQEHKGYTRIKAAGGLVKHFKTIGLKWTTQEPMDKSELVVLRDRKANNSKKKKYIKYEVPTPQTTEVKRYRDDLYSYNQFLLQHCVSLNLTDNQLIQLTKDLKKAGNKGEGDEEYPITHLNLNRLQLRRIFSRGSLTKGGRFYGGWWQSLPSKYRGHILIDNKKTVEVDYSGMSLRIWLALRGEAVPVDEDIYNLGFNDWDDDDDLRRKPIKTFLNAKLNDEEGNYRLPKAEQDLIGVSHKDLSSLLFNKYPTLETDIHAGIGLETQFYDSELAMMVIQDMMAEGIVVLPIHDSFIIRSGFQQCLEKTMTKAFAQKFRAAIGTSVEGTRLVQHFGLDKKLFRTLKADDTDIINLADLKNIYSKEESIMDGYRSGWSTRH